MATLSYKVRWKSDDDDQTYETTHETEKEAKETGIQLSRTNPTVNVAEVYPGNKIGILWVYTKGKLTETVDSRIGQPVPDTNDGVPVANLDKPGGPAILTKKPKGSKGPKAATPTQTNPETPASDLNSAEQTTEEDAMSPKSAKVAKTTKVAEKKVQGPSKGAAKKAKPAAIATIGVPAKGVAKKTGDVKKKVGKVGAILEEFGARENTIRARLISILAEHLNKPVASADLQEALYGSASKKSSSAMAMVLKGARVMIKDRSLSYEIQAITIDSQPHIKMMTK